MLLLGCVQYLDENKSLILRIVESQNSGKLSECAENQARLQRNLMYLAAIADSQPQPPTMHSSQYPGGGVLQPGTHYMQQQQQQMTPQSLMAARSSMFYGAQPYPSLQQQQQALHGTLGMSSSGGSSGLMLQGEPQSAGLGGFPDFIRGDGLPGGARALAGGSKQDHVSAEGRGGSDHHGSRETHYLKGGDDGN
ncbi:grf1-interacting factor 1 [Phtheirospermum japonicum]|uniref:Grf1-interacting factor 1 n=1 Tax=Phtheirospermum japonicum TaxID=374723 RepID=A0A830CR46_9LAMI|nr:grf1-interacting factor 1 [Phtheirospermum japonicum]